MAAGEYDLALPVALEAVQQGQLLFKPSPALQLFPLYLLAAQVCTNMRYTTVVARKVSIAVAKMQRCSYVAPSLLLPDSWGCAMQQKLGRVLDAYGRSSHAIS
jgi:hypothetical protein